MVNTRKQGRPRHRFSRKKPALMNRLQRLVYLFRRNTLAEHTTGNEVTLFGTGETLFKAMLEAIGQAREEIAAEFYIIRDDRTGALFAEALCRAAARGVRVLLLYDYIGCFFTPSAYFARLAAAGVQCLAFNPPSFHRGPAWFDKRDHRKILIVDYGIAFVGSMNIGDEFAERNGSGFKWRETGVRIAGQPPLELRRLFREQWLREGGTDLPDAVGSTSPEGGGAEVLTVSGGPHFSRSHIRTAFRLAFARARASVLIMTPYFIPGPRFIRAMLRSVQRGVRVVLVLPAVSDVPLIRLLSRGLQGRLLAAGVELYECQGVFLHAKVMAIDGDWGILGSANLDHRSFHRNFEVNLVIHDPGFAHELTALIEKELSGCRRLQLADYESRGWGGRVLEKVLQPLAWFL